MAPQAAGPSETIGQIGQIGQIGRMSHAHRTARLVEMLRLFLSETGWNARALAERFGLSEIRIYQDIRALRAGGVPVETTGQGYRLNPAFLLSGARLTRDEMLALLFPSELFDGGEGSAEAGRTARAKLLSCLSPGQPGRFEVLDALREAVWQRRRVRISYRWGSRPKRWEIDPYAIAFGESGWSVVAHWPAHREVRRFDVARRLNG